MQQVCYTTDAVVYPNDAFAPDSHTALFHSSLGAAEPPIKNSDPKKYTPAWVKPTIGIIGGLIVIIIIGFGVYFGINKNKIGKCSTDPCQNGATCVNLIDDYSCTCQSNFYGKKCQWGLRLGAAENMGFDTAIEGRVEVYDPIYMEWEVICDTSSKWDIFDGYVVCRMLGLSGGTASTTSLFGQSTLGYRTSNYECLGMEDALQECPRVATPAATAPVCTGNEVGVRCNIF